MKIRIHKELSSYSTLDPTKDSQSVSIRDLCKDIQKKKLTIPIYQTYLRWGSEKLIALFNFQLSGKAAVSPISINKIDNTEHAVQQLTLIEREEIPSDSIRGKLSLNDGQQRLSCNYMAFINHEELKCIVLDLSKGKFVLNDKKLRQSQIPVGILYNRDSLIFQEHIQKNKQFNDIEIQTLLIQIRGKHFGYYYTVNYAKDLTKAEQEKWFEVLNNAGTRVTGLHLDMTEMLLKGIDFYKDCANPIKECLIDFDLENLFYVKTTEVSAPFAMLNASYEKYFNKKHVLSFSPIPSDAKGGRISSLEPHEINEIILITNKAVEHALTFIDENKLKKPNKMDYVSYLTGAFSFVEPKDLTHKQKNEIITWYNAEKFEYKGDNLERRKSFRNLLSIVAPDHTTVSDTDI